MASQQPTKDEDKGRVVLFRPRTSRSWNAKLRTRDQSRSPVADLSKYSRAPEDDYPHRMFMNLLAFLVLSFIVGCGIWLADNMSETHKDLNCGLVCRCRGIPGHDEDYLVARQPCDLARASVDHRHGDAASAPTVSRTAYIHGGRPFGLPP
jgi:hypothetical protein